MSQSTESPGSPARPNMQNRRLSIIQDTAIDDFHDIDTHAFDNKSPPPHHESSVMSYMESHSPNDESSHKCSPESPLVRNGNPPLDEDKAEMVLEVRRVENRGKVASIFAFSASEEAFC